MKFVINNGAGRRIQCVAWENNVEKFEDIIAINKIIHLDRVGAKNIEQKYNLRNVEFELSIRQSTEIAEKGWYEPHECGKDETIETEWKNIEEMEGKKIKIKGWWVKSTFKQMRHRSGQATFKIGAVTDGREKLEVRITAWSDMNPPFKKGQAVQITGIVKNENYTYLQIANGAAIVKSTEAAMEPEEMINITVTPKKVTNGMRRRKEFPEEVSSSYFTFVVVGSSGDHYNSQQFFISRCNLYYHK